MTNLLNQYLAEAYESVEEAVKPKTPEEMKKDADKLRAPLAKMFRNSWTKEPTRPGGPFKYTFNSLPDKEFWRPLAKLFKIEQALGNMKGKKFSKLSTWEIAYMLGVEM